MGILDSLLDTAMSSLSGGDGQQNQAMKLVMHLVQQNGGNIGGLLSQLQQGGLGDVLQSWIGSNSNESVSTGAIENALGGHLGQAAQAVGIDTQQASGLLAQYLPQIIDTMTPNGQASDADGFGLDDVVRLAQQWLK
mgnify:FL=1